MLAMSIAQRRLERGHPVQGVIMIDSYNTEGWKYLGGDDASDAPKSPLAKDEGMKAKDFSTLHQAHVDTLVDSYVHPRLSVSGQDVPVLLIRAERGLTSEGHKYSIPNLDAAPERKSPVAGVLNLTIFHRRGSLTTPQQGLATCVVCPVFASVQPDPPANLCRHRSCLHQPPRCGVFCCVMEHTRKGSSPFNKLRAMLLRKN